jgi:hypothetical protein
VKEAKVEAPTVTATNTKNNIDFRNANSLAGAFNSDDELPF